MNKKAFTLIEMLAVFAILAIIGSSLSVITSQIFKSYERMRSSQTNINLSRMIIQKITNDVENAFVSDLDTKFRFIGKNDSLNFNTFRTGESGVPEVVEIGYEYDSSLQTLSRRIDLSDPDVNNVTSGGTTEVIAENVTNFLFEYGYIASTATGAQFVYASSTGTWDSNIENFYNIDVGGDHKDPDGLPETVRISFTVSDPAGKVADESFKVSIFLLQDK